MFENNKCIGHAVGGAVVGVAVGMAIQRVLSPNSSKQSSPAIPVPSSRPSICGKKRSRGLEIPKSSKENEYVHFRSKSPCERSKVLQPKASSSKVSSNSSNKSSSKPILIDFAKYSNKNHEIFKIEKPFEINDDDEFFQSREHSQFSLSSTTEYLPLKLQNKENSSPNPSASRSNKKSLLSIESNKKSTHSKSSMDHGNNWSNLILVKDAEDDYFYSEKNITSSDGNIESVLATDGDTLEHRSKICNFIHPTRTSLKSQEFRTLPIYNESSVITSTEYMEN